MIIWPAKDAADVRPYGINWAPMLNDGDTIDSASILLTSGAVIDSQSNDDTTTTAVISGGVNGAPARFTATLVTANGETFRETIYLPIISSACADYQPSTLDKRTVVSMAFEDCGLPGYEFGATPEEITSAIRRLDMMIRSWPCGQRLGYNFPAAIGQSDPDDPMLVSDQDIAAIIGKLAQQMAPGLGKTLSNEQKAATASAYSILLGRLPVPEVRLPRTTPRGSGNRWNSPWQPYIAEANCCGNG